MANFHTNHIAIAANEQDMLYVLKAMALNLASSHEATGYSDLLEDCASVGEAYNRVSSSIISFYYRAFTPDCIGSSEWLKNHLGNAQQKIAANPTYAALASALGTKVTDSGLEFSTSIAPSGRPLSETASVSMDRYGRTFVLQVSYSTAWDANSDDVSNLFKMLPAGCYGVAYLDADEGDGYEGVGCLAGNHQGAGELHELESIPEDIHDAKSLLEYAKANSEKDPMYETDLAKVALEVAACSWTEYASGLASGDEDFDWDEDDPYETYDGVAPNLSSSDHETFGFSPFGGVAGEDCECDYYSDPDRPYGSSISWRNPNGDVGRKEVDSYLLSFVQEFPKDIMFSGSGHDSTNQFIDALVPCSPLVMESKWSRVDIYSDAELHVGIYDTDGHLVGTLMPWYNCDDFYGFGFLTPYLTVTAKDVDPVSTSMSRGRQKSHLVAHFELVPFDFNEVLASVHERAELPENERGRKSVVKEGC